MCARGLAAAVLAGGLLLGAPVSPLCAAPADNPAPVAKVLSAAQSRDRALTYLQDKAGAPFTLPSLAAAQSPIAWWEERRAQVAKAPAARFELVGQTLLLSQSLLEQSDVGTRKRGFVLASQISKFVSGNLPAEKWLLARLYQGFVLPYLTLANVEVQSYPSRQRTLEAAVASFGNADEVPTQKRVLEWMISSATKTDSTIAVDDNTLDWARGTLAALLTQPKDASPADLKRALELLRNLKPENAPLFAYVQTPLEKRLGAAAAPPLEATRQ